MKSRNIQYLLIPLAGLFCLLFTGCDASELNDKTGYGEKCDFQFCMQLPEPISVETKATQIGDDKINVINVWIIQYNASTNAYIKSLYKDSGFTQDDNNPYMVKISTDPSNEAEKFSDVASRFYIIVNGDEALLKGFDGDEATLKAKTVDYKTVLGAMPTFLTSVSEYDPTKNTSGKDKVVFISRLYRTYAKASIQVQLNDATASLTNISATLTNIPKVMALYTAGGGGSNSKYPATVDANTMTTEAAVISSLTSTGSLASFFMPENLRGIGKSDTFDGKNKESNGPGGNLTGCTYLTLKGTYKYNSTHANGIKVEYRFYLGDNLTNNYNIQRDHHYNMTINIKGANSADLRVKITDGNVAVFDEVDVIPNITVDF